MQPEQPVNSNKSIYIHLTGCIAVANVLRVVTYGVYFYLLYRLIVERPFNFISFAVLLLLLLGMFLERWSLIKRLPGQGKVLFPYFLGGILLIVNWILALFTQGRIPPPDPSSAELFLILFFFSLGDFVFVNRSRKTDGESSQLDHEE